jgi:hypothetical protein
MNIGDCMSVHVQLDIELAKLVAEAAVVMTAGPMMVEDLHGLQVSMGVDPLKWTTLKISRAAVSSASLVSTGLIPTRIDKCNKKIVISTIRDPDLFRVKNKFTHDRCTKRLGIWLFSLLFYPS